jgi:hypothetical protein
MINVKGIDRAILLAELYNGTQPLGMGVLRDIGSMSADLARELLGGREIDVDYFCGRPIKVTIRNDEFDPRLYDRDAGEGAAQRAVNRALEKMTDPG